MALSSGFATIGDSAFFVNLAGAAPAGLTSLLYIAEGHATAGTPVEPGHPCAIYLPLASFASLGALGYEPFRQLTTNATGTLGYLMPIPPLPVLIGLTVTFQAAIVDPVGGVPLTTIPGVSIRLSNALSLTIGG
jgi:hypothetical protein